jgi:hypothetical protein
MSIEAIMQKLRRAQRNGTGATLTFDQVKDLAEAGFLHRLAIMEADEICRDLGIEPPEAKLDLRRPHTDLTQDSSDG